MEELDGTVFQHLDFPRISFKAFEVILFRIEMKINFWEKSGAFEVLGIKRLSEQCHELYRVIQIWPSPFGSPKRGKEVRRRLNQHVSKKVLNSRIFLEITGKKTGICKIIFLFSWLHLRTSFKINHTFPFWSYFPLSDVVFQFWSDVSSFLHYHHQLYFFS